MWARLKRALRWFAAFEPARLRNLVLAVFGTLAAVGVTVPAGLPDAVAGVAVAVVTLVGVLLGESTRRQVLPPAKWREKPGCDVTSGRSGNGFRGK